MPGTASGDEAVQILVVDDHPENLLAVEAMLDGHGREIVTASSGPEALRKLLHQEFAVILLDVMMPGMDGFETARLIRGRDASRHIPIIFLTATGSDVELIYRAYSVGAVDYLIKPLSPEVVRAKVDVFVELHRRALRIRRQEAQLREAERLRGEEALRQAESQYEATFNQAAIGLAHMGQDGRWLRANPYLCEMLGYSENELRARRYQDVADPERAAADLAALQVLTEGAASKVHRETRLVSRQGGRLWVELSVSLLRDAHLSARNFVVIVEDVTGRRLAEERRAFLAEAAAVLLSSLDHQATLGRLAELAVGSVAEACVFEVFHERGEPGQEPSEVIADHTNPAAAQLLRQHCRTFTTRFAAAEDRASNGDGDEHPAGAAAPTSDRPGGPIPASALGLPAVGGDRDHVLRTSWIMEVTPPVLVGLWGEKSAREVSARLSFGSLIVVPLRGRETVLGVMTLMRGPSSRRFGPDDLALAEDLAYRVALALENTRLFAQAQEAIRARDEFMSIASHELRTPLTPLLLQVENLSAALAGGRADLSPTKLESSLRRMERQVHRLGALIDRLLDVTRVTAGRLHLQEETVDLVALTEDVCRRFADEMASNGCSLELRLPRPTGSGSGASPSPAASASASASVEGRWDRLRLEQVLSNLLGNAVKYGRGRPVQVTVEGQPGLARLAVKDHGIGIAPSALSRIFKRFERAVSARSYGGLGLGLYISRQIVQAHGGSISVESRPGEGATFTVELPTRLETAERPPPAPESGPERVAGGAGSS